MTHVEVFAAYGRQYTSMKSIKEDWNDGKDFRLPNGSYISKREAEEFDLGVVVRYGKNNEKVGRLR